MTAALVTLPGSVLWPIKQGRPREHSFRELINAVFCVVKTGCPWRNVPEDFVLVRDSLSVIPTLKAPSSPAKRRP